MNDARENRPASIPREADCWQLVVVASGRSEVHSLPSRGSVVLGRGSASDVVVDDASVSRRHALLRCDAGVLHLEDLGSANGSRIVTVIDDAQRTGQTVDRRLVAGEQVPVPLGASIHLGSVVVLARPVSAPPATEDLDPASEGLQALPTDMVVRSPKMLQALELLQRVAHSPLSVLLVGETGVGKDVLARALHAASPRRAGPFMAINCAALSEHLVESELFGHERGAFTGAAQAKPGLLEAAAGGTVFLDEVGELPLVQQSKLLRALEAREVMRVGALKARPLDVRFVAATHKNPARESEAGSFRRDLYFRLSGITVEIPPLRARPEDLQPLIERFAERAARADGRATPRFSTEALRLLRAHPFPGNVRELRNVVERAVAIAAQDVILAEHLLLEPTPTTTTPAADTSELGARILAALAQCGGNQTRAATLLGMSRRTLVTRLGELGITRPRGAPRE